MLGQISHGINLRNPVRGMNAGKPWRFRLPGIIDAAAQHY
jgi:hypothetical protein